MSKHFFPSPIPQKEHVFLQPVFLPFAGCPMRCIFCNQSSQTGIIDTNFEEIYEQLEQSLSSAMEKKEREREIAFYGGTFTMLPEKWIYAFLDLANKFKEKGLITKIRCSTRPDAFDKNLLQELKAKGLDIIELGIQSFNDKVLAESLRGYDSICAKKACLLVKESGLVLGIQLLPGLIGYNEENFQNDIDETIALKPAGVRIYPCLVFKDTVLAEYYEKKLFIPWDLKRTEEELSLALFKLWQADISCWRLGLAPFPFQDEHILAGAWHEALGQKVQAKALYLSLMQYKKTLSFKPSILGVPKKYSGDIGGYKKELRKYYEKENISLVQTDTEEFYFAENIS